VGNRIQTKLGCKHSSWAPQRESSRNRGSPGHSGPFLVDCVRGVMGSGAPVRWVGRGNRGWGRRPHGSSIEVHPSGGRISASDGNGSARPRVGETWYLGWHTGTGPSASRYDTGWGTGTMGLHRLVRWVSASKSTEMGSWLLEGEIGATTSPVLCPQRRRADEAGDRRPKGRSGSGGI